MSWVGPSTIPTDIATQAELGAEAAARAAADASNPSAGEKAALAGTNGTPDGSNRYVTNSDPRLTSSPATRAFAMAVA